MLCFTRISFNQRYELHFRPSRDSGITLSSFSKGNSFSTLKLGGRGAYFQKSQYILWTIVESLTSKGTIDSNQAAKNVFIYIMNLHGRGEIV